MYKNYIYYILGLVLPYYLTISQELDSKIWAEKISNQIISIINDDYNTNFQIDISILENQKKISAGIKLKSKDNYLIEISRPMIDSIIMKDDSRLAFLITHELSHIVLNHISNNQNVSNDSELFKYNKSHEKEFQADKLAFETIIKAGFSFKNALKLLIKMRDNNNFSSFESISETHPTWDARLKNLATADYQFWTKMEAFEKGVFFLNINNFFLAERCFRDVLEEFPDCFEVVANLGYCYLMRYISDLSIDDIKNFGIGAIATGTYYRNPESLLFSLRGINSDLWYEAEAYLKRAIRLNGNSAITNSNLGLLYLVHHKGKPDYKNSQKYFETAIQLAELDTTLNISAKSAIYINSEVSFSDEINNDRLKILQSKNQEYLSAFASERNFEDSFKNILNYNYAILLLKSNDLNDLSKAKSLLEEYLSKENKYSPFWIIGNELYSKLCRNINQKEIDFKPKKQHDEYKSLFFLNLDSIIVYLGDNIDKFSDYINKNNFVISSIIKGTNLKSYSSSSKGIEIIANDKILNIILFGKQSPLIELESKISTNKLLIHPTMEFNSVINNLKNHYTMIDLKIIKNETYSYFPELNLALSKSKNGKINKIAIIYFN